MLIFFTKTKYVDRKIYKDQKVWFLFVGSKNKILNIYMNNLSKKNYINHLLFLNKSKWD